MSDFPLGPDADALLNPAAKCRWCLRANGTHGEGLRPTELGSSLCPVIRDSGKTDGVAGRGQGLMYFGPPTPAQVEAWRASNGVKRPTEAKPKGKQEHLRRAR